MKTSRLALLLTLCAILPGCVYYKVTDVAGKHEYFVNGMTMQNGWNGTMRFTDASTGEIVTLQEYRMKQISKDEFQSAVGYK